MHQPFAGILNNINARDYYVSLPNYTETSAVLADPSGAPLSEWGYFVFYKADNLYGHIEYTPIGTDLTFTTSRNAAGWSEWKSDNLDSFPRPLTVRDQCTNGTVCTIRVTGDGQPMLSSEHSNGVIYRLQFEADGRLLYYWFRDGVWQHKVLVDIAET